MTLLDELKQKLDLENLYHTAYMNDEVLMGRITFLELADVILMDMAYEKVLTDEDEIGELCDRETNPNLQDLHKFVEGGLAYKYCDMCIDNDDEMTYHKILMLGWKMAFTDAYKLLAKQVEQVRKSEEAKEEKND